MSATDPFAVTPADFYEGHPSDPLRAPEGFSAWREATARFQALYERSLTAPAAPRTTISVRGRRLDVLNLASLDYLGLNTRPEIAAAAQRAYTEWGSGACGVPLLSGMTEMHRRLEERLAALVGQEAAVVFSSGFSGAIGLTSALLRRGDVAVMDERAHMSMMDGARLAGARVVTFSHDDVAGLDAALAKHRGERRVVIVDGLYSMDGDFASLPSLLDVAESHGVGLVVDEAHSVFSVGARGGGVSELLGVSDRVRLFFGTLSKSLSNVGGFVAGDRELIDYLRLFAHPYVFSAALPPAVVAGALAGIDIVVREPELRTRLADNAKHFRDGARAMGLDTGSSTSHIVPIVVGSRRDILYETGVELMDRGLYVAPVDYPAVSEDGLRFRCSITAAHSRNDLDEALSILEDVVARRLRSTR